MIDSFSIIEFFKVARTLKSSCYEKSNPEWHPLAHSPPVPDRFRFVLRKASFSALFFLPPSRSLANLNQYLTIEYISASVALGQG